MLNLWFVNLFFMFVIGDWVELMLGCQFFALSRGGQTINTFSSEYFVTYI